MIAVVLHTLHISAIVTHTEHLALGTDDNDSWQDVVLFALFTFLTIAVILILSTWD